MISLKKWSQCFGSNIQIFLSIINIASNISMIYIYIYILSFKCNFCFFFVSGRSPLSSLSLHLWATELLLITGTAIKPFSGMNRNEISYICLLFYFIIISGSTIFFFTWLFYKFSGYVFWYRYIQSFFIFYFLFTSDC